MAVNRRAAGPRATVVAVVAIVIVVGGVLALRGVDGSGTPSATTMDAASSSASASASSSASTPGPGNGDPDRPRGTVVFAPTGTDLPGSAALDRCRSDSRAAVERYDTAALGTVTLQCGDSGQGYRHIDIRHHGDWDDELASLRTDRDWDDLMLSAVSIALTEPGPALPADAGDGKVCYAAPIRFADGTSPSDGFVKVIVSATTDRVITAYPTSRADC
jgi:hypothetical protein